MFITRDQVDELIKLENKFFKIKKYKKEAMVLWNIVENLLQQEKVTEKVIESIKTLEAFLTIGK